MKRGKCRKLNKEQVRRVVELTALPKEVVAKWTARDLYNYLPKKVGEFSLYHLKYRDCRYVDLKNPKNKPTNWDFFSCEDGSIKVVPTKKVMHELGYASFTWEPDPEHEGFYILHKHSPATYSWRYSFIEGCIQMLKASEELKNYTYIV